MEKVVLPIHFEDRSGAEFERLCFAYVIRTREWDRVDWYGQLGGDRGRNESAGINRHRVGKGQHS